MHTITIHRYQPSDIRLGRHVNHDSRSLDFKFFAETPKPKNKSVFWDSNAKVLDQGQVGSCTGNATAQCLNAHYNDATRKAVRKAGGYFKESDALKIYSLGTTLDNEPGQYPPTDTGCDGLSVAKAAQKLGFLKAGKLGYSHIIGFFAAQAAAEITPFIQGTVWTGSMFKPNNGLVKVGKINDSTVEGGHEYEGAGIDWNEDVFIYRNSWGDQNVWPGCKPGGYFAIGFKDVQALLAEQGDITILHGIGE